MKFRRLPSRVHARVLDAPWEWQTDRNERMVASVGDYRVVDPITGAEWSVSRTAFKSGYASVGGDEYESRGTVIARRVGPADGTVTVDSREGPEIATPGDWVVEDADANIWVVADWIFVRRYESVDGQNASAPGRPLPEE